MTLKFVNKHSLFLTLQLLLFSLDELHQVLGGFRVLFNSFSKQVHGRNLHFILLQHTYILNSGKGSEGSSVRVYLKSLL